LATHRAARTRDGAAFGTVPTDDMSFGRRMVLAGVGIGLLPETLGEGEVSRRALVRTLPSSTVRGGAIYVVSPPLRHLPARVKLLREHLIVLPRALGAGKHLPNPRFGPPERPLRSF